jgi:hypothetical protein
VFERKFHNAEVYKVYLIPYQKTKVIGILQRKASASGDRVKRIVCYMKLDLELVRQAFG